MRQGVLILLHNNYEQARKLISFFDKEGNHIFLHIDKKSSFSDADKTLFLESACNAKVTFVDRVSVQWGGYSLVQASMNLFKEASKYELDYYHLISGVDMPLKPWKDFNDFFEKNSGTQFVSYSPEQYQNSLQKRVKYYWIFQEKIGSPKRAIKQKDIWKIILLAIQRIFVEIQRILGIDRRKKNSDVRFRMGSEWVSLTKEFVDYIVSKELWIEKTFANTLCADEVFVETLLDNSKFSSRVMPNQRLVDWNRGNPYVFHIDDLNELLSCDKMFARKFDQNVDGRIIDALYSAVK